jgi:hypothetical protein
LSLAAAIVEESPPEAQPKFIISSVLMRSLFFIAWKCRSGPIRSEAIYLLKSKLRREGIWDSMAIGTLADVITRLEGSDELGMIPEKKRIRAIKASFDLHKRTGRLRYLMTNTSRGVWEARSHEVEIGW